MSIRMLNSSHSDEKTSKGSPSGVNKRHWWIWVLKMVFWTIKWGWMRSVVPSPSLVWMVQVVTRTGIASIPWVSSASHLLYGISQCASSNSWWQRVSDPSSWATNLFPCLRSMANENTYIGHTSVYTLLPTQIVQDVMTAQMLRGWCIWEGDRNGSRKIGLKPRCSGQPKAHM